MWASTSRADLEPGQRGIRKGRLLVAMLATALWSGGLAGQASAQYTNPPPNVKVAADVGAGAPTATASSLRAAGGTSTGSQGGGQGLPVTGGDVLGLTAIGVGSIAVGGLVLAARRRSTRA